MKRIFNLFIILLISLLFVSVTINVTAATGDVYNIVTCPGEDMATQMQINFQSPTTVTNLCVEYTAANDKEFKNSKKIDAEYRSFSRKDNEPISGTVYVGFSTPRYVWNVKLDNLTPKTKYIFQNLYI